MVELLELLQVGLTITAVTVSAVTLPVAVVSEVEMPDLQPLLEQLEERENKDSL